MNQSLSHRFVSEGNRLWIQGHCLYHVRDLWLQAAELDPAWNSILAFINALLWRHEDALTYASMSSTTLAMYVRAWALADTAMQRGGCFLQSRLWKRAKSCLSAAEARYECTRPTPFLYLARIYSLGRLREYEQALAFIGNFWRSWPWQESKVLFLKAAEKLFLDSDRKEAHKAVADLLYSQRRQHPLVASWVIFNRAFISRDVNLFRKALNLHNRVSHHPSCRQYCKYVAQIASLCRDPIAYLNDAYLTYPDSADLLEVRAMLSDDALGKLRDLQHAFHLDRSAPRLNVLLNAALEIKGTDLQTIVAKGVQLHGGIANCDDCLFLLLYVDACCKLRRDFDALAANNRHLELTIGRSAEDPERLSAFEARMNLFRQRFKHRDQKDWPDEYEPVNEEGWTKLTITAAFGNVSDVSPDFIEHIDGGGRSPLFVACQRGQVSMAATLASYGATQVQYWDAAGRQPMEMARAFLSRDVYEAVVSSVKHGERIYEQRRIQYESELFQIFVDRGLCVDGNCFGLILQYLGPQYKIS